MPQPAIIESTLTKNVEFNHRPIILADASRFPEKGKITIGFFKRYDSAEAKPAAPIGKYVNLVFEYKKKKNKVLHLFKPPGELLPAKSAVSVLLTPNVALTQYLDYDIRWSDAEYADASPGEETYNLDDFRKYFFEVVSRALYGESIGVFDGIGPVITSPDGTESSPPNAWGIYHLLDNVPEYALADRRNSDSYYVVGAGRSIDVTKSIENRNRWLIWGGKKYDRVECNADGTIKQTIEKRVRRYGFRVVRVRELAPTWFASLRHTALEGEKDTMADELARKAAIVRELRQGQPWTEHVDSIVAAYQLRDQLEHGRGTDTTPEILDAVTDLPDPYFQYLRQSLVRE